MKTYCNMSVPLFIFMFIIIYVNTHVYVCVQLYLNIHTHEFYMQNAIIDEFENINLCTEFF